MIRAASEGAGLGQREGADDPAAGQFRQPPLAYLGTGEELDRFRSDVNIDAAQVIKGGMRFCDFLDGEAASEHGQPKTAVLRRRVGSEQAHAAQAGHCTLGDAAGLFDRGIMRLQFRAHELAYLFLPNHQVVRKFEIHVSPKVE
jgi:hypothetical protein